MLPWWIIIVVIALVTGLFAVAGPVHGARATVLTYFQAFLGIGALILVGRVLGKRRSSRISQKRDHSR